MGGRWRGHSFVPPSLVCGAIGSLHCPLEGMGGAVSKGSRNKGTQDPECRCHSLPCLLDPPWHQGSRSSGCPIFCSSLIKGKVTVRVLFTKLSFVICLMSSSGDFNIFVTLFTDQDYFLTRLGFIYCLQHKTLNFVYSSECFPSLFTSER